MKKIGIITQARTTSTRLPNKVLKTINNKALLQYHLERLKKSELPIVVATTTNETDTPIVELCQVIGVPFFRGSEQNVLSRFYNAAKQESFDIIVRVTSDCPLIDPELIKTGVKIYNSQNTPWLYLSNCLNRTYPRGFDFEVFSMEMLIAAYENAQEQVEIEHVTPYFYQNKHGKTKFYSYENSVDYSMYRLTVDEAEDFKLIQTLISDHYCDALSSDQICQILLKNPQLGSINSHVEQKKT